MAASRQKGAFAHEQEDLFSLFPKPPAARGAASGAAVGRARFRELQHPIWLHPDAPDQVENSWPHLYQRLGLVLQHLAAHGRTSVVKGCKQPNRGWRRTPLGGGGGNHFYLWWAPAGSRPVAELDLPRSALAIRAIRHHDDHDALGPGAPDDYLKLERPPDIDAGSATPWTPAQRKFASSDFPVRLLSGRPGTGKTTALWNAIEARDGERVLYLTWSRDLRRQAEQRFESFAPVSVQVDTLDFETFLGEVAGADVPRQTLAESRARLAECIERLSPKQLGVWSRRRNALHAELRAFLYGRAIGLDRDRTTPTTIQRLADREYAALRGGFGDGIGQTPARTLLGIAATLREQSETVFPELAAATKAVNRLRSGHLPQGFEDYDRIVVDEVQDLTLLEVSVVAELVRSIVLKGRFPQLMMAGDSGQTVRPTSFDWGPLSNLLRDRLGARLGPPRSFELGENLRSPERLANVVERATDLYRESDIRKYLRPTRQHRLLAGRHAEAGLFHVDVGKRAHAIELLEALSGADDAVVVSATDEIPAWIPDDGRGLRAAVLTPAQVKGLEYQSVCILDPGRALFKLEDQGQRAYSAELEAQARRVAIDHLRVALSRATESLAFVDVEASKQRLDLSRALLEDGAPYDWKDFRDHVLSPDTPPEERVLVRTNDARVFIDSVPERAWQRACQAFHLLGDPELPNGVAEPAVRLEARTALLSTAARLLVDGLPAGVQLHDLMETSAQAIRSIASEPDSTVAPPRTAEDEVEALYRLHEWLSDRKASPVPLLRSVQNLQQGLPRAASWLPEALLPVAQAIRKGLMENARDPHAAADFADPEVENWLSLTHYRGKSSAAARRLRARAFDTLVNSRPHADESATKRRQRLNKAEEVLAAIQPDLKRLGRLREAQGKTEEAAAAYAEAGLDKEELRVWRNAASYERAMPLAKELGRNDVANDYAWLLELEALVKRRPPRQNVRLNEPEKDRLGKTLDAIQPRPPRRTGKMAAAARARARRQQGI